VTDSVRALGISNAFNTRVVGIAERFTFIQAVLVINAFYANVFFCADSIVTIIIGQAGNANRIGIAICSIRAVRVRNTFYTCIISCAHQPISTVKVHFTLNTFEVISAHSVRAVKVHDTFFTCVCVQITDWFSHRTIAIYHTFYADILITNSVGAVVVRHTFMAGSVLYVTVLSSRTVGVCLATLWNTLAILALVTERALVVGGAGLAEPAHAHQFRRTGTSRTGVSIQAERKVRILGSTLGVAARLISTVQKTLVRLVPVSPEYAVGSQEAGVVAAAFSIPGTLCYSRQSLQKASRVTAVSLGEASAAVDAGRIETEVHGGIEGPRNLHTCRDVLHGVLGYEGTPLGFCDDIVEDPHLTGIVEPTHLLADAGIFRLHLCDHITRIQCAQIQDVVRTLSIV